MPWSKIYPTEYYFELNSDYDIVNFWFRIWDLLSNNCKQNKGEEI